MTDPTPPQEFRRPERLTRVPEHLVAMAVRNVHPLVDHDSGRADEMVRRVLAVLHLAAPDMPDTPVYHYPDGSTTDVPIGAASGTRCQWGKLRRGGDVVMCALDEDYTDGEPGPGHDAPGEHAFRLPNSYDHVPFTEDDPRAFHAPTWLGDSPEEQAWREEMRNSPHP